MAGSHNDGLEMHNLLFSGMACHLLLCDMNILILHSLVIICRNACKYIHGHQNQKTIVAHPKEIEYNILTPFCA